MNRITIGGISRSIQNWKRDILELKNRGISHVELRIDDVTEKSLIYTNTFLDEIKELVLKNNMTISIHAYEEIQFGENVSLIQDTVLSILIQQVKIAYYLDAMCIVFHLGKYPNRNHSKNKLLRLKNTKKMMKKLIDQTEETPLIIAIENMRYVDDNQGYCFLGDCLDELYEIKEYVCSSRVMLVADIGHMLLHRKTREEMGVNMLKYCAHICEIHLHFNDFIDDQHKGISDQFVQDNSYMLEVIKLIWKSQQVCILEMDVKDIHKTLSYLCY